MHVSVHVRRILYHVRYCTWLNSFSTRLTSVGVDKNSQVELLSALHDWHCLADSYCVIILGPVVPVGPVGLEPTLTTAFDQPCSDAYRRERKERESLQVV